MLKPAFLQDKNVLLRADLDVPIRAGEVANDYRLQVLLPTIRFCLSHARAVLIIGHLGRPNRSDPAFSLNPVRKWLEKALNQAIPFNISGFSPGEWVGGGASKLSLLENLRFNSGELTNDREFATHISAGANVYVYEAFATYHNSASLQKIPEMIPTVTGLRFDQEVESLAKVLKDNTHPNLLILSGAKEDKRHYLDSLRPHFDQILLGGRLADLADLTPDGLDLNQAAIDRLLSAISLAKTVVFNGPLGKYEDPRGQQATRSILEGLKNSSAFSLVGGGDTLAAIPALGFSYSDFGFVSTGGGAMLEFLATGSHPLLEIIKRQPYYAANS